MKALITGVTGFAGSHLAEHALDCGDEVFGCSRTGRWPSDAPFSLSSLPPVQSWDVSRGVNSEVIAWAKSFKPDVVYHLAALSVTGDCGDSNPSPKAQAVNVAGTQAVIDLVASLPQRPRLFFTSSSRVYGRVTRQNPQVAEDARLEPCRGYDKTKLTAEQMVQRAIEQLGVDVVVARPFHHTGPRQSERMMVPEWAKQFAVRRREPVRVHCLNTFLDLSDVRDVVRAYRELVLRGDCGEVFNVGSQTCVKSGDIFEQMRKLSDPGRDVVELSPGRRQHPIADISRLAARTGWQPAISLQKTLRDTLEFWKQRVTRT